jgi:hypothetical protein
LTDAILIGQRGRRLGQRPAVNAADQSAVGKRAKVASDAVFGHSEPFGEIGGRRCATTLDDGYDLVPAFARRHGGFSHKPSLRPFSIVLPISATYYSCIGNITAEMGEIR